MFFVFKASLLHNQTPPPPQASLAPQAPPTQTSQQQSHPHQAPPPQTNAAAAAAAAAAVAAAAAAAVAGAPPPPVPAPPRGVHNIQTHEMNIPNDLIGCIIGRGGQKISEIRYFILHFHYIFCFISNFLPSNPLN